MHLQLYKIIIDLLQHLENEIFNYKYFNSYLTVAHTDTKFIILYECKWRRQIYGIDI